MNDSPIKLLTPRDLVEMGVFPSEKAASVARSNGTGPAFLKLTEARTGRIRYRAEDVVDWLAGKVRETTRHTPTGQRYEDGPKVG